MYVQINEPANTVEVKTDGAPGDPGPRGSSLLRGPNAPTPDDGLNGDFWLEETHTRLYGPKVAGVWPSTYVSMTGLEARGLYDIGTNYGKGSLVRVGNKQWRAIAAVPAGNAPAENAYWTIFFDGDAAQNAAATAADLARAWASQPSGQDVAGAPPGSRSALHYAGVADGAAAAAGELRDAIVQVAATVGQIAEDVTQKQALVAADRVQTGNDRLQTGANAVSANASAVTGAGYLSSVSAIATTLAANLTAVQLAQASIQTAAALTSMGSALRTILLGTDVASVYLWDTSKDLDDRWRFNKGASWRQGSPNTTLANGLVIGNRLEAPRMMALVLRTSSLDMFDLDTMTGDLWRRFPRNSPSAATYLWPTNAAPAGSNSVCALDGMIAFATGPQIANAGVILLDLAGDELSRVGYAGNGGRGLKFTDRFDQVALPIRMSIAQTYTASQVASGITMGRVPFAQRDPSRRGMPRPLIASNAGATTLGFGVIRPDGTMTSAGSTNTAGINGSCPAIDEDGTLWYVGAPYMKAVPPSMYMVPGLSFNTAPQFSYSYGTSIRNAGRYMLVQESGTLTGRFHVLARDRRNPLNSLWGATALGHATGLMAPLAAQKLALAESSACLANIDTVELVPNGDFSNPDISAWYSNGVGNDTLQNFAGQLVQTKGSSGGFTQFILPVPGLVVGDVYKFSLGTNGTNGAPNDRRLAICTSSTGVSNTFVSSFNTTTGTTFFIATAPTMYLTTFGNGAVGQTQILDNISIQRVASDRSSVAITSGGPTGVTWNPATVVGTLTRSVVAANCDIAWYGGFDAANYLTAAVMNALGLADWALHGIAQAGAATAGVDECIWRNVNPGVTGARQRLYQDNATGFLKFEVSDGTTAVTATGSTNRFGQGVFRWLAQRVGNSIELYVNGVLEASASIAALGTLTTADAVLLIGNQAAGDTGYWRGNIGQFRVGLTSYSSDQIALIDSVDFQMIQPGAKSLMLGSTTLRNTAYDAANDQIAVATTVGTSFFNWPMRTDYFQSTAGYNKFLNSGYLNATTTSPAGPSGSALPITSNGVTLSCIAIGDGYFDVRMQGTATGAVSFSLVMQGLLANLSANAGEDWTFSNEVQIIAGSTANFTCAHGLWPFNSANGLISGPEVPFVPTTTNTRYSQTVTAPAGIARWYCAMRFRAAVGAVDVTLRFRRPQLEKASAFTAFVDGLTNHDSHIVAANDNTWLIGTGAGVDLVLPAVNVRDRILRDCLVQNYDPTTGKYVMRTTDATATNIGFCFVPEGKSVGITVDIVAIQALTGAEVYRATIQATAFRAKGASTPTVTVGTFTPATAGTVGGATIVASGDGVSARFTGKAATEMNVGVVMRTVDVGHMAA